MGLCQIHFALQAMLKNFNTVIGHITFVWKSFFSLFGIRSRRQLLHLFVSVVVMTTFGITFGWSVLSLIIGLGATLDFVYYTGGIVPCVVLVLCCGFSLATFVLFLTSGF